MNAIITLVGGQCSVASSVLTAQSFASSTILLMTNCHLHVWSGECHISYWKSKPLLSRLILSDLSMVFATRNIIGVNQKIIKSRVSGFSFVSKKKCVLTVILFSEVHKQAYKTEEETCTFTTIDTVYIFFLYMYLQALSLSLSLSISNIES